MGRERAMRLVAEATALVFGFSYLVRPAEAALATTCYIELSSKLFIAGSDFACGVVNDTSVPLTCCSVGDICLGHSICQVPTGPRGPGYSGYYLGGCNDPNYKDPSCTTHCTSNDLPDVVYNTTTKQWNCCNTTNSVVDCNNPIAEAFDAPAPTDLSSTFSIPASTATSTSSSSSSTSNPTTSSTTSSTPTPSQTSASPVSSSSSSSSLSTGAQAGIGIGASIAGLSIISLLAILLRRHYTHRHPSSGAPCDTPQPNYPNRESQTFQNPARQNLTSTYAAQEGSMGFVVPKAELPTPEQHDPRFVLGRTGTDPFEWAGMEVRRELGIMP